MARRRRLMPAAGYLTSIRPPLYRKYFVLVA